MKGFITYPTYRIKDGKAYVYLFGRLENGDSFLTINHFRPYFYVRTKDKEKLSQVKSSIRYDDHDTKLKTFFGEPATKITLDVPRDVPDLRDSFHKEDIPTYEADIRFVYRFMMDKGIKGGVDIKGEHRKGEHVDRIYEEPVLEGVHFRPKLKILSLDIETSMDAKDLYAISIYTDDYKKVLCISDKKLKHAEIFKNEKEMLVRFTEVIQKKDPDIITGWNLIDFDLKVLKEKCEQHNVPFVLGRTDWESSLRLYDSFFRDSTADIAGRAVLDGMHLLRISFISLSDFKLQTAAEEILGATKLQVFDDLDKGTEIERLYREEPQALVDYNLQDAKLVIDILEEKGIIDLTIQRSLLTGMQLDRVKASIASLDNLYLREARKRGYVCPTSDYKRRGERITGGYVKDSIPGIYDYIDVLDFKSLYPSIMRTFNIDPLSHIPQELHDQYEDKDVVTAPNGAKFTKEYGILPMLLQQLWKQRDKAKKKDNQTESYAIKITMNSFFGVLANPMCRFYSLEVANAITHFGQHIVKTTADLVEKMGYRVIYGDTDSIFVETAVDSMEEAKNIGNTIQEKINKHWEYIVTKEYGMENFLDLEFEKTYVRFMMPRIRGTKRGAKKRYAGLLIRDGEEKLDFTGLEFVRRDWTDVSKKFQLNLLDRVFHKQEVGEYIRDFVEELKSGRYDDLLIYKKALRKDLKDYVKTTPPHVKAARKLDKVTSNIIAYVMTVDGPEPVQNQRHSLDYDHYIEKQIKPIADSILGFYEQNFDEVLKDTRQTSLGSYG